MKSLKLSVLAFILSVSAIAWGEEPATEKSASKQDNPPEVLLDLSDATYSGYGALYTRYSKAGDTNGCFVGARGGLIINDSFVFGLGGMGLVYPTDRDKLSGNEYTGIFDNVSLGYGGFLTEYYFNPKNLVVFSIGTLIGGGGIYFTEEWGDDEEDDTDNSEKGGDNFFVVEPEINVFINLTRFCRIGAGISYRYVNGIHSDGFSDSDFRGPAASIMVQMGWF